MDDFVTTETDKSTPAEKYRRHIHIVVAHPLEDSVGVNNVESSTGEKAPWFEEQARGFVERPLGLHSSEHGWAVKSLRVIEDDWDRRTSRHASIKKAAKKNAAKDYSDEPQLELGSEFEVAEAVVATVRPYTEADSRWESHWLLVHLVGKPVDEIDEGVSTAAKKWSSTEEWTDGRTGKTFVPNAKKLADELEIAIHKNSTQPLVAVMYPPLCHISDHECACWSSTTKGTQRLCDNSCPACTDFREQAVGNDRTMRAVDSRLSHYGGEKGFKTDRVLRTLLLVGGQLHGIETFENEVVTLAQGSAEQTEALRQRFHVFKSQMWWQFISYNSSIQQPYEDLHAQLRLRERMDQLSEEMETYATEAREVLAKSREELARDQADLAREQQVLAIEEQRRVGIVATAFAAIGVPATLLTLLGSMDLEATTLPWRIALGAGTGVVSLGSYFVAKWLLRTRT